MRSSITNKLKPTIRRTLRYCPSKIRITVHVLIKLSDHLSKNMQVMPIKIFSCIGIDEVI